MKRMVTTIVCLLLLLGAGPALITPRAHYQGVLWVGGPGERNPPGGLLVIRDRKSFDAFVGRIPRTQITPTSPAPPSDDPLLAHPSIDFSKSTVIVAYSGSMLTDVSIEKLESDRGKLTVRVRRQQSPDMASVPLGVGCYHCVVIDKWDGPIAEP